MYYDHYAIDPLFDVFGLNAQSTAGSVVLAYERETAQTRN